MARSNVLQAAGAKADRMRGVRRRVRPVHLPVGIPDTIGRRAIGKIGSTVLAGIIALTVRVV